MYVKVLFKQWNHTYLNEAGVRCKKDWDYSASYGAVLVHESEVAKYKGKYPELHTVVQYR